MKTLLISNASSDSSLKRRMWHFLFIYFLISGMVPSQDGETIPATPLPGAGEAYIQGKWDLPHLKVGRQRWKNRGLEPVYCANTAPTQRSLLKTCFSVGAEVHRSPNFRWVKTRHYLNCFVGHDCQQSGSSLVSEVTILLSRGRNSWHWCFITWITQEQATQLSHRLNKGCFSHSEMSVIQGFTASCNLFYSFINTNHNYLVGILPSSPGAHSFSTHAVKPKIIKLIY